MLELLKGKLREQAYHLDKLERGFERLIDIWGADHHDYVPRVKAALQVFLRTTEENDPKRDIIEEMIVQLDRGDGLATVLTTTVSGWEAIHLKPVVDRNFIEITLVGGHHLTLLARNQAGWHNLCWLISQGYARVVRVQIIA